MEQNNASRGLTIFSFAAIYFIWGSTYLAIRVGVETIPPALFAAGRWLFAAPLLVGLALARGARFPRSGGAYASSAVAGLFLLFGGNGGVVWAARYVPSGLSALIVATVPFWMTGIERVWRGGERTGLKGKAGILIGFLGVLFLLWPDLQEGWPLRGDRLAGEGVLLLASLSWAFGSIYSKHAAMPEDPLLSTGLQMFFGGAALAVAGIVSGECEALGRAEISSGSLFSFLYLIAFGSCLGFTAYGWLLRHVAAAKVATYAYVNPLVAVFLGWLILGESFGLWGALGMVCIVGGVFLVISEHV